MPTLSPEQQIDALLCGRAHVLAREHAPPGHDEAPYAALFTLSAEAIHDHVQRHGLPPGACQLAPDARDGLYLVDTGGRHRLYWQERGMALREWHFADRSAALAAAVDELLVNGSRGLYVRSRSGRVQRREPPAA
jgi:hypothetical protein